MNIPILFYQQPSTNHIPALQTLFTLGAMLTHLMFPMIYTFWIMGKRRSYPTVCKNFIHKTSTAMTKDHHISEHCLRAYKDGYPFYSTSQYIADRNCIFSGEWNKEQRETRFFIKKYNISPGSGTETAILWLLSTNRSGRCREYRFW